MDVLLHLCLEEINQTPAHRATQSQQADLYRIPQLLTFTNSLSFISAFISDSAPKLSSAPVDFHSLQGAGFTVGNPPATLLTHTQAPLEQLIWCKIVSQKIIFSCIWYDATLNNKLEKATQWLVYQRCFQIVWFDFIREKTWRMKTNWLVWQMYSTSDKVQRSLVSLSFLIWSIWFPTQFHKN